ncbi:MAG: hypothetical protein QM820_16260 [Minicystis sp.]
MRVVRLTRLAALLPLLSLFASARAEAVEVPNVGGKPLLIDVTNTAVLDYRFNNRNDADIDYNREVDDFYGEWLDRFNVQASWWRFRLGVRLDAALFFHTLSRDDIAARAADKKPIFDALAKRTGRDPADIANDYANGMTSELHSRFRRSVYPAKLFAGYNQPGLDVTVGDFYVQLGRGLVFSVRKIDELAVDTTVRGVKVVADKDVGSVHLAGTLFAGQMNPHRVDETSGRRLQGAGSPLFFGFPGAGDLQTYDVSVPGKVVSVVDPARPNYLEDTAFGARFEVGTKWFSIAANGAMLLRKSYVDDLAKCLADKGGNDFVESGDVRTRGQCASQFPVFATADPTREHDRILNVSGSINVPSIAKHGDLYVEVAGQQMAGGHGSTTDLAGYAVYANASITGGPVSVSLEGKHYRNFFTLAANIDTQSAGFGAPEYALVTYSQPPTAEPIYTQIVRGGSPNVCISGGRGRVDYRFNRSASIYAWLGRYTSWSEVPTALDKGCEIKPENQTNTWDTAAGVDLNWGGGKSHVQAWVGARVTDFAVAPPSPNLDGPSTWFYTEGYVRYDIVKHLAGPFSLQLQGFHRKRYEPLQPDENAWFEGENYTALQWSPHLSAIFGYEYLVKDHCQPGHAATATQAARAERDVCHYVNGGLQWRSGTGTTRATKALSQVFNSVNVFVGQRRAALRCVSGVCRQFPPFEGARLEITSRF